MRESQTMKIPYTLVIGDKEMESETVNYRLHGSKDTTVVSIGDFCNLIKSQVEEHK